MVRVGELVLLTTEYRGLTSIISQSEIYYEAHRCNPSTDYVVTTLVFQKLSEGTIPDIIRAANFLGRFLCVHVWIENWNNNQQSTTSDCHLSCFRIVFQAEVLTVLKARYWGHEVVNDYARQCSADQ